MRRLQRFLAIPMGASALAALWLLDRLAGEEALLIGAAISMGVLFSAYEAGRLQRRNKSGSWGGAVAAVALAVAGVWLMPEHEASAHQLAGAEPWSEARVAGYVQQGHPVFVYFTADWCLSCKVNEATSIDRSEVRQAFDKAGVKVLAGDWTNGDPAITRFLESRGRAGVPYYLWYSPRRDPQELPQVLTPAMLIDRARSR